MTESLAALVGAAGLAMMAVAFVTAASGYLKWSSFPAGVGLVATSFAVIWNFLLPVRMEDLHRGREAAEAISTDLRLQLTKQESELVALRQDIARQRQAAEQANNARNELAEQHARNVQALTMGATRLAKWLEESRLTSQRLSIEIPSGPVPRIEPLLAFFDTVSQLQLPFSAIDTLSALCAVDRLKRSDVLSTRTYAVRAMTDSHLVANHQGTYLSVKLLDSETAKELIFAETSFDWSDAKNAVKQALSDLHAHLLLPLKRHAAIKVFVRGSADGRPFANLKQSAQDGKEIYVIQRNAEDRTYLEAPARVVLPRDITNADLPNLRAAHTADLMRSLFERIDVQVLDNPPSPDFGAHLQNVEIIVFIPS